MSTSEIPTYVWFFFLEVMCGFGYTWMIPLGQVGRIWWVSGFLACIYAWRMKHEDMSTTCILGSIRLRL